MTTPSQPSSSHRPRRPLPPIPREATPRPRIVPPSPTIVSPHTLPEPAHTERREHLTAHPESNSSPHHYPHLAGRPINRHTYPLSRRQEREMEDWRIEDCDGYAFSSVPGGSEYDVTSTNAASPIPPRAEARAAFLPSTAPIPASHASARSTRSPPRTPLRSAPRQVCNATVPREYQKSAPMVRSESLPVLTEAELQRLGGSREWARSWAQEAVTASGSAVSPAQPSPRSLPMMSHESRRPITLNPILPASARTRSLPGSSTTSPISPTNSESLNLSDMEEADEAFIREPPPPYTRTAGTPSPEPLDENALYIRRGRNVPALGPTPYVSDDELTPTPTAAFYSRRPPSTPTTPRALTPNRGWRLFSSGTDLVLSWETTPRARPRLSTFESMDTDPFHDPPSNCDIAHYLLYGPQACLSPPFDQYLSPSDNFGFDSHGNSLPGSPSWCPLIV